MPKNARLYFCYSVILKLPNLLSSVVVKNRTEAGSNKRQGEEHIIEKCREAESSEVKSLR